MMNKWRGVRLFALVVVSVLIAFVGGLATWPKSPAVPSDLELSVTSNFQLDTTLVVFRNNSRNTLRIMHPLKIHGHYKLSFIVISDHVAFPITPNTIDGNTAVQIQDIVLRPNQFIFIEIDLHSYLYAIDPRIDRKRINGILAVYSSLDERDDVDDEWRGVITSSYFAIERPSIP